jgi:hypothetical protein
MKHPRTTHPGRGETMSREREGQRRAAKREQVQRRSVAPRESGREHDADHQPRDTLAVECESRAPVQGERGDCDRRDPQRQVQTHRAGSAQQRIAHRAEDDARHEQRRDGAGWHGIEASRPLERLANAALSEYPSEVAWPTALSSTRPRPARPETASSLIRSASLRLIIGTTG